MLCKLQTVCAKYAQDCTQNQLFCMNLVVYILSCAAVCCAVLCCAVLCCAVLCCAVRCCAVLCCAVLCCAVPCCAVLHVCLHGGDGNRGGGHQVHNAVVGDGCRQDRTHPLRQEDARTGGKVCRCFKDGASVGGMASAVQRGNAPRGTRHAGSLHEGRSTWGSGFFFLMLTCAQY